MAHYFLHAKYPTASCLLALITTRKSESCLCAYFWMTSRSGYAYPNVWFVLLVGCSGKRLFKKLLLIESEAKYWWYHIDLKECVSKQNPLWMAADSLYRDFVAKYTGYCWDIWFCSWANIVHAWLMLAFSFSFFKQKSINTVKTSNAFHSTRAWLQGEFRAKSKLWQ